MIAPVQLASGYAAPEGFPLDTLSRLSGPVLTEQGRDALQYGPREGFLPLRQRIVQWLLADGVPAKPEEVVIVTGAKQGLDIAARSLCSPEDAILMSVPNYMNGITLFRTAGPNVVGVSSDHEGTDVNALEGAFKRSARSGVIPRLIYETPDFQNPTGTVLSAERREKLVFLAKKYDAFILEDNPYRWLRFKGESVPSLKTFDAEGRVISVGTFAKILGPGLRIGWVHARRDLLDKMMRLKADAGTSPLTQRLAFEFFREEGSLERHLEGLRHLYTRKRDAILGALNEYCSEWATWTRPSGGYYIWMKLAAGLDSDLLVDEAKAAGVLYYQGSVFFTGPTIPKEFIRLCYAYEPEDRIVEGVRALASVIVPVFETAARRRA